MCIGSWKKVSKNIFILNIVGLIHAFREKIVRNSESFIGLSLDVLFYEKRIRKWNDCVDIVGWSLTFWLDFCWRGWKNIQIIPFSKKELLKVIIKLTSTCFFSFKKEKISGNIYKSKSYRILINFSQVKVLN